MEKFRKNCENDGNKLKAAKRQKGRSAGCIFASDRKNEDIIKIFSKKLETGEMV
jgi:hypothetical protein